MELVDRRIAPGLLQALDVHPIVFLNGPWQAGKSTLVRDLAQTSFPAEYVTFDNATSAAAAASAPREFLSRFESALIVDEVQLVPELFRALKVAVDELRIRERGRTRGRFLLTGSADVLVLPGLTDALVGRMGIRTLYPFAACEVHHAPGAFIDRLFGGGFDRLPASPMGLAEAVSAATFPQIVGLPERERADWFEAYLTSMVQRDVRGLSEIEKPMHLTRMLQVLASRAGALVNDAAISRDVGLNPVTGRHYRSLLGALFLTFDLPPWFRNIGKRLVKSAKGYIGDTQLLCHLLGRTFEEIRGTRPDLFGHALENFVVAELVKLNSFAADQARLYHFRTADNREVDVVLERRDGSLAAVEVKAADHVEPGDFRGLRELAAAAGPDFVRGVVLYLGSEVALFGDSLWAVPIRALWV